MSEYTRPATWEDVKTVARYLDEAGAEYALVGAYAIAAHGYSRFSEDIDILVNPSAQNSRRWILALSRLPDGAAAELAKDPDVFTDRTAYAIRINDEFTVRCQCATGRTGSGTLHTSIRPAGILYQSS